MKSVVAFVIFAATVVFLGYGLQVYQQTVPPEPIEAGPEYAWEFREVAVDSSGMPFTQATLVMGEERFDAGIHAGSCAAIGDGSSAWTLLPDEKAGAVCWFAGGGSEIGVFERGGFISVQVGALDEGSEEVAPFRGDFKTIFEIGPSARVLRVNAGIGRSASAFGVTVTPLEVLEDSRCPLDAQCVQAGTVRIKASIGSGSGASDTEMTLGDFITTEVEEVTLIEVRPAPLSGALIAPEDYGFVFRVVKR